MKTKSLNAAQIDTLAQRLSATPVAASASAKKAGDNLAFLLAARIGDERAALAFTSILIAATAEQAEARLTLVLDYGNTEPAGEVAKVAVEEPKPPTATAIGKRQAILNQAQTGALPQAPDFSKATHVRFRASLPRLLPWPRQATSPPCRPSRSTSSSPKAMARYRDLCVMAITARAQVTE